MFLYLNFTPPKIEVLQRLLLFRDHRSLKNHRVREKISKCLQLTKYHRWGYKHWSANTLCSVEGDFFPIHHLTNGYWAKHSLQMLQVNTDPQPQLPLSHFNYKHRLQPVPAKTALLKCLQREWFMYPEGKHLPHNFHSIIGNTLKSWLFW